MVVKETTAAINMMWEDLAVFDTTLINFSSLVVSKMSLQLLMLRVHTHRCHGAGYKNESLCFVKKIQVLFQLGISRHVIVTKCQNYVLPQGTNKMMAALNMKSSVLHHKTKLFLFFRKGLPFWNSLCLYINLKTIICNMQYISCNLY